LRLSQTPNPDTATQRPQMSALDLRHAARLFRQLPLDPRDERGQRLKSQAIAELLRLAQRRTRRPA
jgi:hypothetical protein